MPDTLYTSQQIADRLGVTPGRVRQIANERNLGTVHGGTRLYTEADVAAIEQQRRPAGRPFADDRSRVHLWWDYESGAVDLTFTPHDHAGIVGRIIEDQGGYVLEMTTARDGEPVMRWHRRDAENAPEDCIAELLRELRPDSPLRPILHIRHMPDDLLPLMRERFGGRVAIQIE